jgi:glycine betaine/proline transport system substrate-binding protein
MTRTKLLAVLAAFALIAAACGTSGTDTTDAEAAPATDAPAATEAPAETEAPAATEATDDDMAMPGEGVSVTMARADWTTGYFQAAVYEQLLEELGYEVSDPADLELGPSLAYLSMAQGDFDFWVNSWYPGHISWWEPELPDGSRVGDHLTVFGPAPDVAGDFELAFQPATGELVAGGLQGYLMTKTFAEEFDLKTLDDLNSNADALAAFDAQDPVPGNGIADIYGCQESWTCDNIITSQIAFSGWENIQQTIAGYDAMIAEAVGKANAGEPMVIYTWTPSAYITQLRPGDNVVWVGVEDVIDDSNPAGQDGGEGHDQRPGTANIGPDQCPLAADLGTCQLGWIAADILVTANKEWAAANPAAAKLLSLVTLPIIDVSLANVAQDAGQNTNEDIQGLAAEWIANNRDLVDSWLAEASASS